VEYCLRFVRVRDTRHFQPCYEIRISAAEKNDGNAR